MQKEPWEISSSAGSSKRLQKYHHRSVFAIDLSSSLYIAVFLLQTDLSDLSIDPMLKSEISNALKSMGQPNVPCTGLSKPFLVSTG